MDHIGLIAVICDYDALGCRRCGVIADELPQCERVNRRDPHFRVLRAKVACQATSELSGGRACEGEHERAR
jgi:hypothetical protein